MLLLAWAAVRPGGGRLARMRAFIDPCCVLLPPPLPARLALTGSSPCPRSLSSGAAGGAGARLQLAAQRAPPPAAVAALPDARALRRHASALPGARCQQQRPGCLIRAACTIRAAVAGAGTKPRMRNSQRLASQVPVALLESTISSVVCLAVLLLLYSSNWPIVPSTEAPTTMNPDRARQPPAAGTRHNHALSQAPVQQCRPPPLHHQSCSVLKNVRGLMPRP